MTGLNLLFQKCLYKEKEIYLLKILLWSKADKIMCIPQNLFLLQLFTLLVPVFLPNLPWLPFAIFFIGDLDSLKELI